MKRIVNYIGKTFLVAGFLGVSILATAQDGKLSREERKEMRKAELAANYNLIGRMLADRRFVLEAYYLGNQYGDRISVSPNINFIKVNASNGILQTGVLNTLGYNGVGGVTTEGNVGRWEIHESPKNYSYHLRFSLHTHLGSYDITINISGDNHARAEISGLTPGKLIYEGELQTLEKSRVFKGSNTL